MTGKPEQPGHVEQTSRASDLEDPVYLQELRQQMLKFAILQLSHEQLAEDAVQEAFVGALRNVHSFARRSALKTWVFAILKNKIADVLRRKRRLKEATSLLHESEENEDFSELFDARGHWREDEKPVAWVQPEAAMQNQHFWLVFATCLEGLPGNQARVFMMREYLGFDTGEICDEIGISISNLHVMLYRSRLRLRECLENRWFLEGEIS